MAFNFSVYQTPPGRLWWYLPGAGTPGHPRAHHHVTRGQKYPLMLLDFSKNCYPDVKLYGEFKNRGPKICTYPQFPIWWHIGNEIIVGNCGKCGWVEISGPQFLNSPYNFTSGYQFLEKSNNIEGYFWPRALWWCARGCPGVPAPLKYHHKSPRGGVVYRKVECHIYIMKKVKILKFSNS